MKYNKLIRDKIPEIIAAKGGTSRTHIADSAEYWNKLKEKLAEEVAEFAKDESAEELADILEVIDAICEFKEFDAGSLRELQKRKKDERGGFKKYIILEES